MTAQVYLHTEYGMQMKAPREVTDKRNYYRPTFRTAQAFQALLLIALVLIFMPARYLQALFRVPEHFQTVGKVRTSSLSNPHGGQTFGNLVSHGRVLV